MSKLSRMSEVIANWLPMQIQNTKPFLATAGENSKFSAALTWFSSNQEKQMEYILRITCLEEDFLVVFPTGLENWFGTW